MECKQLHNVNNIKHCSKDWIMW